jgi:RecB family exonuclease
VDTTPPCPRRIFLGWDRPALPAVAEWLAAEHAREGTFDLSGLAVVLPGSRAARRLLELLVLEAERRSLVLTPPRMLTPASLADEIAPSSIPSATAAGRLMTWVHVLRTAPRDLLGPVFVDPPKPADLVGWTHLASLLDALSADVASACLDFARVGVLGSTLADFREQPRWAALGALQQRYLETLTEEGLADRSLASLTALADGRCRALRDLVLVGCVDLPLVARRMLAAVASRVTALVHAPEDLADRFAADGCLEPDRWADAPIDLGRARLFVADRPADQATRVVAEVARLEGRHSAREVLVGVPATDLAGPVERRLREASLPARQAAGAAVLETAPAKLLAAMADFLESQSPAEVAALLRHPEVEAWLGEEGAEPGGASSRGRSPGTASLLGELDRYLAAHLPASLAGDLAGKPEETSVIENLRDAMARLAGQLVAPPPWRLRQWVGAVAGLLERIEPGGEVDREAPGGETRARAIAALGEALAEIDDLPAGSDLDPVTHAHEALRILLGLAARATVPAPESPAAIELVGWLELPLDDAPVVIVTGLNEGQVPEAVNSDLFLPNTLRTTLGLLDNARRYARDAWALSALVETRESLTLIAGRRNGRGDPLVPSRLVFACEPEVAARRLAAFYDADEDGGGRVGLATPRLPGRPVPGRDRSGFEVPRPTMPWPEGKTMSPTGFRDYLACPYRFYLRHVLGLKVVTDSARELDAAQFGTLVHAVLADWGRGEQRDSTDPYMIAAVLEGRLEARVRESYGTAPLAPVRMQVAQARARLHAFAHWQAGWAKAGWRIVTAEEGRVIAVEEEFELTLMAGGVARKVKGRIDRVDRNVATGETIVLDYKTGEKPHEPDEAHRDRDGWKDLQLPLYMLAKAVRGARGSVLPRAGYVTLPRNTGEACGRIAPWTPEEIDEAREVAEAVLVRVHAGEFWPPAPEPPWGMEEFAAICQDGQLGRMLEGEE